MKLSYYYIVLCIFLFSCASKQENKFSDQVSVDLAKVFDLNDKKFDKFKVSDLPDKKSEDKAESIKTKKASESKKTISKQAKKIKKNEKLKKEKLSKKRKTPIKKGEVTLKKAITDKRETLPEDYPAKFLEYDKKSKEVWAKFTPTFYTGENFTMSISYLGITAGHVKIETKRIVQLDKKETFHFVAQLESADFYKYVYSLNDKVESYISKDLFLPKKYSLTQRESGQSVDDLQLFDQAKRKTFFWYKRLKKGKTKTRQLEKYTPNYFQDSFSSLYFVRGLPLKNGDLYEFPVVTRGKIWLIKMKVSKREKIKIMGNWIKAVKIAAETHFPGVLKKKGDILFWYSDDSERRLLKFEAKVKIGALTGELVEYVSGKK